MAASPQVLGQTNVKKKGFKPFKDRPLESAQHCADSSESLATRLSPFRRSGKGTGLTHSLPDSGLGDFSNYITTPIKGLLNQLTKCTLMDWIWPKWVQVQLAILHLQINQRLGQQRNLLGLLQCTKAGPYQYKIYAKHNLSHLGMTNYQRILPYYDGVNFYIDYNLELVVLRELILWGPLFIKGILLDQIPREYHYHQYDVYTGINHSLWQDYIIREMWEYSGQSHLSVSIMRVAFNNEGWIQQYSSMKSVPTKVNNKKVQIKPWCN